MGPPADLISGAAASPLLLDFLGLVQPFFDIALHDDVEDFLAVVNGPVHGPGIVLMRHPLFHGAVQGAYDLHVHVAPDVPRRRIDDHTLAQRFAELGLAGFALKSHYTSTAERAQVVSALVPKVRVAGTLTLNWAVGGLNALAVEIAARANETKPPPGSLLPDCTDQNGIAAEMIDRRHEKRALDALHDLVRYLAGVREERKAILAVTNGWLLYRPNLSLMRRLNAQCHPLPTGPAIGVGPSFSAAYPARRIARPIRRGAPWRGAGHGLSRQVRIWERRGCAFFRKTTFRRSWRKPGCVTPGLRTRERCGT